MNKTPYNIRGGKFVELSENYGENMFYQYFCTDSSSLVNVSPWELAVVYVFSIHAA